MRAPNSIVTRFAPACASALLGWCSSPPSWVDWGRAWSGLDVSLNTGAYGTSVDKGSGPTHFFERVEQGSTGRSFGSCPSPEFSSSLTVKPPLGLIGA